jgi:hypothetical protein
MVAALTSRIQIITLLIASLRSLFRNQQELTLENLVLRQQLAIFDPDSFESALA